jgi:Flp pilus assembly protein TadB
MQVLLITFLAVLILTPFLFSMSRELKKLDSLKDELERYEEIPETRNFTRRWLFGWQLSIQRAMHRAMVNTFSDKLTSFLFRLSGYFFLLMIVVMWIFFALFVASSFAN